MDAVLDSIWENIVILAQFIASGMFNLLEPLHVLGPAFLISLLAFITVAFTKLLKPVVMTKRYKELEKNFNYWLHLREEAMKIDDREKGRQLARNIDQAELNRAYYDYFFEGFMLGLARKVMPVFFMFGFINEMYRPEQMVAIFGQAYVALIPTSGPEPMEAGPVFWYVVSILASYLLWFLAGRIIKKIRRLPFAPVRVQPEPPSY